MAGGSNAELQGESRPQVCSNRHLVNTLQSSPQFIFADLLHILHTQQMLLAHGSVFC